MALRPYTTCIDISKALTALDPLPANEYFVAFGTDGQQFCGTPNGYSVMHLPAKVVKDITTGRAKVRKIVCASFGSNTDSWFFRYETFDGSSLCRYGNATPAALRQFIESAYTSTSPHLFASLRVQLGTNDSFLAWTRAFWICHNIPNALKDVLIQESSQHGVSYEGLMKGVFRYKPFAYISWHDNGSFYVGGSIHQWNFESNKAEQGWNELWREHGQVPLTHRDLTDLAFAAIDPHSADGNTFVFIKKQKEGKEADFVLRFAPEDIISRLAFFEPKVEERLQHSTAQPQPPRKSLSYTWTRCRRTGRPHPKEDWELHLEKGRMVKILEDRGRDWYLVQNACDMKGYAHKTWLDFNLNTHVDPREAYALFTEETNEMLKPGTLRQFPDLSRYMNACTEEGCKAVKQDIAGVAICAHDLERLLRGSGCYTVDFLKSERNTWHPDKFARFCHPDSRDELKAKAGALFVLYGILIDVLHSPPNE